MSDNERNNSVYYDRILRIILSFSMFFRHVILYDIIHVFTTNEQIFCRCIFTMMNKECALAYSGACGSRLRHHHCTPQCASCRMLFVYNRKCNFLLYKNVLVRYRTRTTYIVVPPYFTDSLRLPASLSRIHSLSTLTGASRHSLLVPASEYISLTFFLIVRLLILHGSGFRCAALGCIRSLFLRAPLTCRLLSVRVYPPLLLPFIAFAYWLYFLYLLLC